MSDPNAPRGVQVGKPQAQPSVSMQQNAVSQNYHPEAQRYRSPTDPSLLPIYQQLQKYQVNFVTDQNDMMRSNANLKDGNFGNLTPGGFQDSQKNMIVMNSQYSNHWWHDVPHEYAHQEVAKKGLEKEQNTLFKDQEDMADSYADYYNDPTRYTKENPTQSAWFQKNFVNPPSPVKIVAKTKVVKVKK